MKRSIHFNARMCIKEHHYRYHYHQHHTLSRKKTFFGGGGAVGEVELNSLMTNSAVTVCYTTHKFVAWGEGGKHGTNLDFD